MTDDRRTAEGDGRDEMTMDPADVPVETPGDGADDVDRADRAAAPDRPRAIATADAPGAIGPYSQAVIAGGWLYSAGQIALPPDGSGLVSPDVGEQAEQVFANLAAILNAAGASLKDVVKTTVYLADMDDFAGVNEIYARHFEKPYPARSTVAAAGLPKGALVEIDVVARLP